MGEGMAHMGEYVKALVKWLAIAVLIGLLCGGLGVVFDVGVELATAFRERHGWLLWCLPAAGLVIVGLYKLTRTEGLGTNAVLESVHWGSPLSFLLVPTIFFATILTHLCGGSAGREGAALQMGGGIGRQVGVLLRQDEKDIRIAVLCGMSAFFAALFGTPLTAAIFALEVVSVGMLYYAALVPCVTSALVAYGVSVTAGVTPTSFAVVAPALSADMVMRVIALSMLCALVSILLCETLHRTEDFLEKFFPNPWLRIAVGGGAVVALTLGTHDYNGAGMAVIGRAMEGQARPEAFLLKILLTALTIGAGFRGGEVVPTFFVGATFGCTAGALLGIPPEFGAAVGLVAVFCGAVNCPVASMVLSVELFGAEGLLFFAMACGVGYMLSGYRGLYSSQTILYSKVKAEFIDARTRDGGGGKGKSPL